MPELEGAGGDARSGAVSWPVNGCEERSEAVEAGAHGKGYKAGLKGWPLEHDECGDNMRMVGWSEVFSIPVQHQVKM